MKVNQCMIVFVKYPTPGEVKTRLAATTGNEFAMSLYRLFVADTLDMLGSTTSDVVIACDPQGTPEQYSAWLGNGRNYFRQTGSGVGERMANAFTQAFSTGYSRVLLMGSDIPDLPAEVLGQAFSALSNSDAVIGPSTDGGYYLIGFNKGAFTDEVFRNIAWSTPAVLKDTCARLDAHHRSTHILLPWSDVDTRADLQALYERNRNTLFAKSRTMRYLDLHEEVIDGEIEL